MPDADVIARAAIELVADGSALVDSLKVSLDEASAVTDTFAAEWAAKMTKMLAADFDPEALGQSLAVLAASTDSSLDAVIEKFAAVGETWGRSKEELVALAESYKENLQGKLTEALNRAATELQTLGQVTPETVDELKKLATAADTVAVSGDGMASRLKAVGDVMAGVKAQANETGKGTTWLGDVFKKLGIPMSDVTKQGQFVSQMLSKVGLGFASAGTAATAAFAAFKIFGGLKKLFSDAVSLGVKMSEVNFRLEVAVRASQRAIGEQAFSIKEAKEQAQGLSDTYGQSIVAMTDLVGTAVRTTSEMDLTKGQIKDLTKAAVVMNETMGIDSKSALMQISMFMQSGYGRALSRNGFAVTRAAQQQQAYAMGIRKSLKDMTEAEKQAVRYALVMRQVDKYSEDAAAGQTNLAKSIAHAAQEQEKATEALGGLVAPIATKLDNWWTMFWTRVTQGITAIIGGLTLGLSMLAGGIAAVAVAIENLTQGRATDFMSVFAQASELAFKDITAGVDTLSDAFGEGADAANIWQQEIDDALTELEPALEDFVQDFLDAKKKLEDDFAEDFQKTFDDTAKDIVKAELDRERDLRDINEQAALDRIQTTNDYQKEEIRITQDHFREMRDLETQYLFDLQDAVRERDARQVLLLQRRYNLEKTKAEEEYRVGKTRRQQDFQDELLDIEQQRLRKRVLRIRDFEEEKADLLARGEQRRAELSAELAKNLAVLRDELIKNVTDAIWALVDAGVLSPEQALALGKAWGGTLGAAAGSEMLTKFNEAMTIMYDNANKAIRDINNAMRGTIHTPIGTLPVVGSFKGVTGSASVTPPKANAGKGYIGQKGFAIGGDFIATAPQTIQVGERPERVSIQPLNRATGDAAGTMGGAGRRGGGGKVEVAIALSEGLEGNIVDQAMAEVADVFVTLNRGDAARGAGGRR